MWDNKGAKASPHGLVSAIVLNNQKSALALIQGTDLYGDLI
jgi:hypothetical protein